MKPRDEQGFTLIELVVVVSLLSIISSGFYVVLFSGMRGGDTARNISRSSEEARLGFNRIVRDTRESDQIAACTTAEFPTCYHAKIDFDGDGLYQNPNSSGDFEDLTYTYHAGTKQIRLNGSTLLTEVVPVGTAPVFTYTSNRLEYDTNGDGVTSNTELDSPPIGNGNGLLDGSEITFIDRVTFALRVVKGASSTPFHADAQLRNLR